MKYLFFLTFFLTFHLYAIELGLTLQEKEWLKKNPEIIYVGDPNWLPFEAFKDKKYVGIVADLLKHIQNTTPLKFKIISTSSWQESVDIMDANRAMIMSQSRGLNNQTTQLFTQVYYKNPIVIVMDKKHHYVPSLYNIDDKKIVLSSGESFVSKIKSKYSSINFIESKTTYEGIQSVAFGESDAFVNTLAQTSYALAKLQLNDLRIVGRTELYTELGFGVSQNEPLLKDIMDKALNSIPPDVKNDILAKWIHQEYVEKPDYMALYIALGIFFLIALIVVLFYLKVRKEVKSKLEAQDKMLQQQSKMAAMGEMLDAVAHQWKQPLNALSMYLDLLKSDFESGEVDKVYIDDMQEGMHSQITHMTTTLGEFRNFFRPESSVGEFKLLEVINAVLLLTKDEFLKNQITIELEIDQTATIHANANEFKHLILNIINNAKDAFNENEIQNRKIIIRTLKTENSLTLEIEDNAGGIPKDVIEHIFNSNFTTKEDGKGTGIGLYMSSQIVQKMNATISVKNINNGACFYISF